MITLCILTLPRLSIKTHLLLKSLPILLQQILLRLLSRLKLKPRRKQELKRRKLIKSRLRKKRRRGKTISKLRSQNLLSQRLRIRLRTLKCQINNHLRMLQLLKCHQSLLQFM